MAQARVDAPRVLIVGQHFWPESFRINDIADYFVEQGLRVDVLCGLPNYPKGEFIDGYGYFGKRHEVHNSIKIDRVLEIKRGNNSNMRILINYLSYPFFSLFHIPKLLTRKYDQIFIYQLSPVMMATAGILLGKMTRTPTTMYVLDLWPENLFSVLPIKNGFLNRLVTKWSHWYYRRADKLIAMTPQMQQKLAEVTKKHIDDILVLPQSTEKIYEQKTHDPELRKRFRKSFNVLFTGNISPAQDPATMVAAAEILHKRGYKDIRWIIVGDGMSRKDMEASVREKQLDSVFSFEGFKPVEDIPKYADVADVLVGCLVKSELLEATIPAKVTSYLALGKPIVLAMDGEAQNLINEDALCGFAGPTEDAAIFASNIEKLYKLDNEKQNSFGKNAEKYHRTHFERSILLEKLVKIMTEAK